MRSLKDPLIIGTFLLTMSGVISRFLGFYYKLFLIRQIGADEIGIFQLSLLVLTIHFAIASAGIQTNISRFTASADSLLSRSKILYTGLFLSLSISAICMIFLLSIPHFIACHLLKDAHCAPLLFPLALSLPFSSIHNCFCGYYLGCKRAGLAGASQLFEQVSRIFFFFLLASILSSFSVPLNATHAAWGIFVGELFAALFCLTISGFPTRPSHFLAQLCSFFESALPLTANRLSLTLFQSLETVLLPTTLMTFGYARTQALGALGVLSGIVLPLLLLPTTFSNSFASLLLPMIAQAQAQKQTHRLRMLFLYSLLLGLLLGLCSTLFFLFFGPWITTALFQSPLAKRFLSALCWLCPFLYLNSILSSILHGLGRTKEVFLLCVCANVLRICMVLTGIPRFGIRAYFLGLLIAYALQSFCLLLFCLSQLSLFSRLPVLLNISNTEDRSRYKTRARSRGSRPHT